MHADIGPGEPLAKSNAPSRGRNSSQNVGFCMGLSQGHCASKSGFCVYHKHIRGKGEHDKQVSLIVRRDWGKDLYSNPIISLNKKVVFIFFSAP